jgi:DNA-binding response OmpR family regulator
MRSMGSSRKRILLVDDDATLTEMLQAFLQQRGFAVEVAYGGAEALEKAAVFQPDLILLDIGLPDISGLEVLRRLRSSPATAETIMILLTGTTGLEMKIEGFTTGADDYVAKPIVGRELLLKIERFLSAADSHQRVIETKQKEILRTLANTLVHELSAPLAAIQNELQLASQEQDAKDLHNRLRQIANQTRSIQEILQKLSTSERMGLKEPVPGFRLLDLEPPPTEDNKTLSKTE